MNTSNFTHSLPRICGALVLALFISACSSDKNSAAKESDAKDSLIIADKIIINAKVHTVDENNPWADAVAIKDKKLIYVGNAKGVTKYRGSTTQVIDGKGGLLLPGFHDAHVHPLEGMSLQTFMGCDLIPLSDTETSPETWIEEMRKCNDIDFPHDWILGGGHAIHDLLKLERTPRALLDEIFPDKPAAFMEKSSHSMWVNSKALERVGIDKDTPDPQGGLIFKDLETKEPIGILSDSAGDELMHKALQKSPQLQAARYDALVASQDFMAEHGITSMTNARVYWERGNLEPWLKAEQESSLKARSILALWAYPHMEDEFQLKTLKSMYRNDPEEMLRLSQVKFYSDGVVINNSAAVIEAYNHLIHPYAQPYGINYFTEARMGKYIAELEKVGFSAHIHALGDRAIFESLNAIEFAQKQNPDLMGMRRHQLTHVVMARPADIERFAELHVAANIQINADEGDYGAGIDPYDKDRDYDNVSIDDPDYWYKIVGDVDVLYSPVFEIDAAGGLMVLSSDWDVASIDPLVSIRNAVALAQGYIKKTTATAMAIKFYTLNAAYLFEHDHITGSIETGKYADLVLLDKNIFELPVERITDAKVVLTLLGGEETYTAM